MKQMLVYTLKMVCNMVSRINTYVYLFICKRLYNHVKWGKLTLNKLPIFRFHGNVILGDYITFTSSTKCNMVGISKPCSVMVLKDATLSIGNYSGFSGVSIYCAKSITIGEYCNFGGNVSIWDTDFHPLNYKMRRVNNNDITSKPIIIGNDVFVGAHSIILKGVTIGDRVIIGAGSVVSNSIPSNEIWAGNPARFIKHIYSD